MTQWTSKTAEPTSAEPRCGRIALPDCSGTCNPVDEVAPFRPSNTFLNLLRLPRACQMDMHAGIDASAGDVHDAFVVGVHLDGHGLQPFDIEQLLLSHPRQVAYAVIGPNSRSGSTILTTS